MNHRIARELAALGPAGWHRVQAVFVCTAPAQVAEVIFFDEQDRSVRAQPGDQVLALVREQRDLSARLSDGPWWRLLITLTKEGSLEVDYDYGDEPFPDDQLFPPEVYRADLEVYPRDSLPVWLAAYIGNDGRQSRTAQQAAAQARADRAEGVKAEPSWDDFPAMPVMWARWAVLAAAFVAAGSQWGPRVLPSLGWFEGAKRGGSTLYVLPGGRAVLSGGVWNAPELDAVYNGGEPMPGIYAGAPEWVANPVLNPRAANGLLSFCYWWEGGKWYRGESPTADQLSDAVPGVWTEETVIDVVCGLLVDQVRAQRRGAVADLVTAAEVGLATRATLADVFGDDGTYDIDSAFYQLTMAGVTMTLPEPMPEDDAIEYVRRFAADAELDTSGYPLEQLRAERISVGWMVYVPTEPGEIAIGRAIFYVADDGVLEQSSSSVAPSRYIAEFEERFRRRHGSVNA
ncbi:hypothetical protein IU433_19150 [Nocardia puris]|nr:hypothetical protein [Nocardia puris]MBF6366813.1 hypothetical protein [Nocardia puris]MBF6461154.1 hypothetical protein [Nocardia puris]